MWVLPLKAAGVALHKAVSKACHKVLLVCTFGMQLYPTTLAVAAAEVKEAGSHTSKNGANKVRYIGKVVDGAMVANNPTLAGLSFMVDKQKVSH